MHVPHHRPLGDPLLEAEASARVDGLRRFDGRAAPSPARVLVVEDEAIIAWELAAIVEDLGHEVCGTALTAPEAVRLAVELQPRLVLMDVRLGRGGDGVASATAIRATSSVPILFCTAHAHDPATIARVETLGVVGLLAKPIEPEALSALLNRLLGQGAETPEPAGEPLQMGLAKNLAAV